MHKFTHHLSNYLFVGLLILAIAVVPKDGDAQNINDKALRAHTYFLAHNLLEGRGTASRGESIAALYLISQLRENGVVPTVSDSTDFRISVPLIAHHFDYSKTNLKIHASNINQTLTYPDFYHPGGNINAFQDFSGRLLYAGTTSNAIESLEPYTDLSGYVIVLSPPWNDIGKVEAELKRRGANGAIEIVPNKFYDKLRVARGPVRYSLISEIKDQNNQGSLPSVVVGPKGAKAIGAWNKLKSNASMNKALPLDINVEINLSFKSEKVTAYNVLGLIPGKKAEQSNKYIVFLAHYDHVGYGEPTNGDAIWNGFVDNSTGTAMLLEIARYFSKEQMLDHSVLFLFTTAEEQGLLGSNWFVHNSPIPLEDIEAVINLDGGAPPDDIDSWTVAINQNSNLEKIVGNAIREEGSEVETKSIIADSDHWPFHIAGVPSLFLYPQRQAEHGNVHTAKDEWQSDFSFKGLAKYAETAIDIAKIIDKKVKVE